MMSFPDYATFMRSFLDAGYTCAAMDARDPAKERTLYVRHDIDFDVAYARALARIEADAGVSATYYFMMTSESYNLLSSDNVRRVHEIREMGHKISIHFDPVAYVDFVQGLQNELMVFNQVFKTDVDIISIHRPNDFFLSHNSDICGISHTYQERYCQETFYSSDSQGRWRFGDPRASPAFAEVRSIHLLVHPIWWVRPEEAAQDKLDGYVSDRIGQFIGHIEANCKSYSSAQSIHREARVR